jgi:predicted nucleic acid-binding protein
MRVVLDTNVLLSGLLWHGTPHTLIERVRKGALTLVSSPALLAELAELRALAEVSEPAPLAQPVCRDPDDDAVLALAIATHADLIVSGDRDLLALKHFQDIAIVTPAAALLKIEVQA